LASYTVGILVTTGSLKSWNIGGALKATFWGAVGGAVSFGVGEIFSVASEAAKGIEKLTKVAEVIKKAGGDFGLALVQAGTHAVSQGILAVVQGDSFLSAAAGGFFGSLGAKAWGGAMKNLGYEKFAQSTIGTVAFGALSGGIGAELSGGNFWQGAAIAGVVTLFNHMMHKQIAKFQIKKDIKYWYEKAGVNPEDIPNMNPEAVKELMKKVPELKQLYDDSGKFKISINTEDTRDLTTAKRGERIGTIIFGTNAFKSNLSLGISIIHETKHALDIYTGNIYKFDEIKDISLRTAIIEYRAYDYELKYAPSSYNRSGLNFLNHYGKYIYENYGLNPNDFLD